MKELGEKLKDKREETGVSLNEVSDDLELDVVLLENLEDGNSKVFKDIYELKDMIFRYAKYLGLNQGEISDDFNDYVYSYTSKISKEDLNIGKARVENKQIVSPYTKEIVKKDNKKLMIIAMILLSCLLLLLYFLLKTFFFDL